MKIEGIVNRLIDVIDYKKELHTFAGETAKIIAVGLVIKLITISLIKI
jgi:hypothetical protein